jgi:hypothetical protein
MLGPVAKGIKTATIDFTNTAMKHPYECPSGKSRNPGKNWMPDQVRHDVVGALCCQ